MSTTTVHLRWDGQRLPQKGLMERATAAVKKVRASLRVKGQLGFQAHVDEAQQYVQLTITGDCSSRDADRMRKMLQKEFRGKTPWWRFW